MGMASVAPQYDRPSLGQTVRLTNIPALGTHKPLRPPQVLKVSCACRVIGEYLLAFWERPRKTMGIHGRNLASEYLIGNKPDRQGFWFCISVNLAFPLFLNNFLAVAWLNGLPDRPRSAGLLVLSLSTSTASCLHSWGLFFPLLFMPHL
jgi:hypothetical protein